MGLYITGLIVIALMVVFNISNIVREVGRDGELKNNANMVLFIIILFVFVIFYPITIGLTLCYALFVTLMKTLHGIDKRERDRESKRK